jgi:hypothetical protein
MREAHLNINALRAFPTGTLTIASTTANKGYYAVPGSVAASRGGNDLLHDWLSAFDGGRNQCSTICSDDYAFKLLSNSATLLNIGPIIKQGLHRFDKAIFARVSI